MAILIQRVTTRYSELEDRLLLQVELPDEETAEFWLSRRFLDRLLPVLIQQIDHSKQRDAHYNMLQAFNQQAAISSMKPCEPVETVPKQHSFLITSVDIQANDQQVRLIFRIENSEYVLNLDNTELRQWLWIIYKAFQSAEWQSHLWPSWFKGEMDATDHMH